MFSPWWNNIFCSDFFLWSSMYLYFRSGTSKLALARQTAHGYHTRSSNWFGLLGGNTCVLEGLSICHLGGEESWREYTWNEIFMWQWCEQFSEMHIIRNTGAAGATGGKWLMASASYGRRIVRRIRPGVRWRLGANGLEEKTRCLLMLERGCRLMLRFRKSGKSEVSRDNAGVFPDPESRESKIVCIFFPRPIWSLGVPPFDPGENSWSITRFFFRKKSVMKILKILCVWQFVGKKSERWKIFDRKKIWSKQFFL